jgi:capsule polysaccharide export protein KpsE/RkpR
MENGKGLLMKGCASANLKKTFFLVCFLAVHGFSAAQNSGGEPYTFLRKYIACSQSDLAALQRGVPLAKVLQTDDPNEVAIFGAIRVQVPAEFFLQQYRDIVHFKWEKRSSRLKSSRIHPALRTWGLSHWTSRRRTL